MRNTAVNGAQRQKGVSGKPFPVLLGDVAMATEGYIIAFEMCE